MNGKEINRAGERVRGTARAGEREKEKERVGERA